MPSSAHIGNVRSAARVRTAALLAAAGAAAVVAGFGAGSANAVVGENLPDNCLEFSANGTSGWNTDGDAVINWDESRPVPGKWVEQATFSIRNTCATPGKFQMYAGNWALPDGGSALVRANAGSVSGPAVPLTGQFGILVVQTGRLTQNQSVPVKLFVGIPAGETQQGFRIVPSWSPALEEVAGDAPVDPVDPTDPTDPSGGSSSGSLGDIFGNLLGGSSGSSASSPASAASLTALDAPVVIAG